MAQTITISFSGAGGTSIAKGGESRLSLGQALATATAGKPIELLSYSHGVSMPLSPANPSNTDRRIGRCHHNDFVITKYVDVTTPVMNSYCSSGANIQTATVKVYASINPTGGTAGTTVDPDITYTLSNVIVSSVSVGGGGGDRPIETLTLNYTAILWSVTPQDDSAGTAPAAAMSTYWDLASSTANTATGGK
jgi:type VI secretion system secreted protein Hcp